MTFASFARICTFSFVLECLTSQGFGQAVYRRRIDFGVAGGVPLQRVLRYQPNQYEGLFGFNSHDDDSFPIVIGPALTINFTKYVAFEGGALYRPIRLKDMYIPSSPTAGQPSTTITRGSWWEFPLLGKVFLAGDRIRPFADGGVLLHVEHGETSPIPSRYFQNTSTAALALGGGVEWNRSHISISPGLRYSNWTKRYANLGWSATPNRIDLLVTFAIH
jgi:hypothetical protein